MSGKRGLKRSLADDQRLSEALNLYRQGLSLREIGARLTPPISQQRLSKIFAKAVSCGILSKLPRSRRRRGADVTAEQVREAARKYHRVGKLAHHLRVDEHVLRDRFADVLREVALERAASKNVARKRLAVKAYHALVDDAGRMLTAAELSPALVRRVSRAFGSFDAFWEAVGDRPARGKPDGR